MRAGKTRLGAAHHRWQIRQPAVLSKLRSSAQGLLRLLSATTAKSIQLVRVGARSRTSCDGRDKRSTGIFVCPDASGRGKPRPQQEICRVCVAQEQYCRKPSAFHCSDGNPASDIFQHRKIMVAGVHLGIVVSFLTCLVLYLVRNEISFTFSASRAVWASMESGLHIRQGLPSRSPFLPSVPARP